MIYIAAHKKTDLPSIEGYIPLQVGAALKEEMGYLRDCTGENISEKNPEFCELTGLYWIWKNTDDEFKGLVHYRRFFGKSNLSSKYKDIYSYEELVNMLSSADMVIPYVEFFKQNAKDEIMIQCCTEDIFEELRKIVADKENVYLRDFDMFWKGNRASLLNMMFCKKKIFDQYCEWLFGLLFELENRIDTTNLDPYRRRVYGFLSERLLNVWVNHNGIKVERLPVVATETSQFEKIQLLRRRITNRIVFNASKLLG